MLTVTDLTFNPGPQSLFAESEADIVVYGGQAGGGKTYALLLEAARHTNIPGYRAAIFRRTYPQIMGQGGLFDTAMSIYPFNGASYRAGSPIDFTWENGSNIGMFSCQHEQSKYDYQGHQFDTLCFDEVTQFTETQFFYLLSRNRSVSGVRPSCRCTCNPDPGSWVARMIEWWIDQDSGYPILERSGVIRFVARYDEKIVTGETLQSLLDDCPGLRPGDVLTLTFIPASLDDNPQLEARDPRYRSRLAMLPEMERMALQRGNWKSKQGAIIRPSWIRYFDVEDGQLSMEAYGMRLNIPTARFRRFAVVDTAGTSKEKAAEARGKNPSWSVCGIVDSCQMKIDRTMIDVTCLRHVWRDRVDWDGLKRGVRDVCRQWNVPQLFVENAHFGQPLASELKGLCQISMIPTTIPGMADSSKGAKLERAIASGFLSRVEHGQFFIPRSGDWVPDWKSELLAWTGHPDEVSDQIDIGSHASYCSRAKVSSWGGVVQ
jgi:hypothetical protein